MKKIYLLLLMAVSGTGYLMAQNNPYPSWSWNSNFDGDWRAYVNAIEKEEYKIWVAPDNWDASTQNVMDVWERIPQGAILDQYILNDATKKRVPSSDADFKCEVKYMWDLDNLYVLVKATDDFIYPADSAKEAFELMYATYPDSIPMEVARSLDADFAASAQANEARQSVAYWNKAGAYKLNLNTDGGQANTDYSQAWNSIIGWGASAAPLGITHKFTKLSDTEYTFMAVVPWTTGFANFVPSADTAIALELKVFDFDLGQAQHIEATANTTEDALFILMCYAGRGQFSNDQIGTVGVKNNTASIFTVYPNPVVDKIQIKNYNQLTRVTITNIAGQQVKEFNNVTSTLELGHLSKGLYLVNMYNNNKVITEKIIVE